VCAEEREADVQNLNHGARQRRALASLPLFTAFVFLPAFSGCMEESAPGDGEAAGQLPAEISTAYFAAEDCCTNDAECQDGLFCNGREHCNCWGECEPVDSRINVCNDGNPCTADVCDDALDVCHNTRITGPGCGGCTTDAECDDGDYCNGAERCDASGACIPGTAPCVGACQACNEAADRCDGVPGCCTSNADCTDGLWCNGEETCNASNTCVAGTAPCTAACGTCNETADRCDGVVGGSCSTAADCCGSPGACLDWACNAGSCQPVTHTCPARCGSTYHCAVASGAELCMPDGPLCPGTCFQCDAVAGTCSVPYAAGTAPAGCCDAGLGTGSCPAPSTGCQANSCNTTTYACITTTAADGTACNTDGNPCTGQCVAGACNETLATPTRPLPAGCCLAASDCGGSSTCAWWNCPTTGTSSYNCQGPSYAPQLTACTPPVVGTCQIGICTGPAGYTDPVGGSFYGPGLCVAIDTLDMGTSCTDPISLGSLTPSDAGGTTRQALGNNTCGRDTWMASEMVAGTQCYEALSFRPLGQDGNDLVYYIDIETDAASFAQSSYLVEVMSNFDGNVYVTKSTTCASSGLVLPQPCSFSEWDSTVVLEETCSLPTGPDEQHCSSDPDGAGCYIWCSRNYNHPLCGAQTWTYPNDIYNCALGGYSYKAIHVIYPDSTDYGLTQRYYIYVDASGPVPTTGDFMVRVTKQAWSNNPCDRNTDNLRLYNATGGGTFRGSIHNYVNDLHAGGSVCTIYSATTWVKHFPTCFAAGDANQFWPAMASYLIDRRAIGGTQTYCIRTDEGGTGMADTVIGVYRSVSNTFCDGWVSDVACRHNTLGLNNGTALEVTLDAGKYVVGVGEYNYRDYPCRSDCGNGCNYTLHIDLGSCP
jgi:hypothetical protein